MKNAFLFLKNASAKKVTAALSLFLSLVMCISSLPAFAFPFEEDGNKPNDKYPIMEEIPYSFPVESGDMTVDELKRAELLESTFLSCINVNIIDFGHVKRLKEQEPDDSTLVYQNRDASKTVYLFSKDVKDNGEDKSEEEIDSTEEVSGLLITDGTKLILSSENSQVSRFFKDEERELKDYNIGYAELCINDTEGSTERVDITDRLRNIAGSEYCRELTVELSEEESLRIQSGNGLVYINYTYSDISGVFSLGNSLTRKYLKTNENPLSLNPGNQSIQYVLNEYVFYYNCGYGSSYSYYYIKPLLRYYRYIKYTFDYEGITIGNPGPGHYQRWILDLSGSNTILIKPYDNLDYAINEDVELEAFPDWDYSLGCYWKLRNHSDFYAVQELVLPDAACMYVNDDIEASFLEIVPEECYTYSIKWFYEDGTPLYSDPDNGDYYTIETPGKYTVYCYDEFSESESDTMDILVSEYVDFGTNSKKTYAIRPHYESSSGFYDYYLTIGDDTTGNSNPISIEPYCNSASAYSAKWVDKSQTFTINRISGTNKNKIAATLSANQYTANGNQMPTYNAYYDNTDWSAYHMVYQSDVPNYITKNGNAVVGANINSSGNEWMLFRSGTATYGTVTAPTYVIGRYETEYGEKGFKALSHSYYHTGTQNVSVSNYYDSPIFDWTINEIGINIPLIKQTKTTYCGFTSLLQIMYGAGTQGYLTSSLSIADQINVVYDSNHANGAVYDGYMSQTVVCNQLNGNTNFLDGSFDYQHFQYNMTILDSGVSNDLLLAQICTSLDTGWAPFILVHDQSAPYQMGGVAGAAHYICLTGYDEISDQIMFSNCHYADGEQAAWGICVYGQYAVKKNTLLAKIQYLYYAEREE